MDRKTIVLLVLLALAVAVFGAFMHASRLRALDRRVAALEGAVGDAAEAQRQAATNLAAEQRNHRSRLDEQARSLESLGARLDDLGGRLAEAAGAVAKKAESDLAEMRATLRQMETLWAEKARLLQAIPAETLAAGYTVPWKGDAWLDMTTVGEGVVALEGGKALAFRGGGHLRSRMPATALTVPLAMGRAMSVAVVLRADNLTQAGPARIVSISRDPSLRNLTIGQEGTKIIVRFRTTQTSPNGTDPHLESPDGAITGAQQHVVFVRDGEENLLYVSGALTARLVVPGDTSNWDHAMPMVIANEATADRTWEGEIHRVTFYNRALSAEEVAALHAASVEKTGAGGGRAASD